MGEEAQSLPSPACKSGFSAAGTGGGVLQPPSSAPAMPLLTEGYPAAGTSSARTRGEMP